MSNNPASPLLGASRLEEEESRHQTSSSRRSSRSSRQALPSTHSDESTPLLLRNDEEHANRNYSTQNGPSSPAARSLHSNQEEQSSTSKSHIRWPTVVALTVLSCLAIAILALGFAAPAVVKEYTKEAAVFEPSDLSIDSITNNGVRARIRGKFQLDASRVSRKSIRDLGRAGTWIAKAVETKQSEIEVYLPERGNVLLGTATVEPIVVSIRNGHVTPIDVLADLKPGDVDGFRQLAKDWLDGRLGQLRVQGKAKVPLKSGIFGLGTQGVSQTLNFASGDLPSVPKYNITKFNVHEVKLSDSMTGMAADVSITAFNDYPLTFTIPALGFDILVPGCSGTDELILFANATTQEFAITPKTNVVANAQGIVRQLPHTLTAACPGTQLSPLDVLLREYMNGAETTVYVRGADAPSPDTPSWMSELIKSVTLPVPFPGHTFSGLIRSFTMDNVHLGLPDPFADRDDPASSPKISAVIKVIANLPKEMNFPIGVNSVRANADVFFKGDKLGFLDLREWQKANSTRIRPHGDVPAGLAVDAIIKDAPLNITNDDVFTDLIQEMIFGGKRVVLGVKANVDVKTETAIGAFVVRDIPAEGKVPVKPISGHGFNSGTFSPKIDSLKILNTTRTSMLLEAKINVTNPTNYSATVPYVDILIMNNGTVIGNATAKNISFVPGNNADILVRALWNPTKGGDSGRKVASELLSQYISGFNTTITLRAHENSFPSQPRLGLALSKFKIKLPTPKLGTPKNPNHPGVPGEDGDDGKSHFIEDATMHLITSTATFTLLSPLRENTVYVTHLNATAYYNHTEEVGVILYDLPFAIPPGATTSPRLPVDWDLGSVGFKAVKDALGGTLKLDAEAIVGIRLGLWEETIWYKGGSIGAHIRP